MNKDTITVYWSPAQFVPTREAWDLLYADIESLENYFVKNTTSASSLRVCPGVKSSLKNSYFIKSNHDDFFKLPSSKDMEKIAYTSDVVNFNVDSRVALSKRKPSSIDGYINLEYNMGWAFFAEESLIAKFTAPYFPTSSIAEGALFAPGKFDIGSWFRPVHMDIHVPLTTQEISIKTEDPLIFVEFETNKKIILKRFIMTEEIFNMMEDYSRSPSRYGFLKSLPERYKMAKNTNATKILLKRIKENVLD